MVEPCMMCIYITLSLCVVIVGSPNVVSVYIYQTGYLILSSYV